MTKHFQIETLVGEIQNKCLPHRIGTPSRGTPRQGSCTLSSKALRVGWFVYGAKDWIVSFSLTIDADMLLTSHRREAGAERPHVIASVARRAATLEAAKDEAHIHFLSAIRRFIDGADMLRAAEYEARTSSEATLTIKDGEASGHPVGFVETTTVGSVEITSVQQPPGTR